MSYDYLLTIAIILLSTKVFGLTSERVHMPQVVGALIAGVLVGPSCLNWVGETDFLVKAAELGVIILMFNAGMDTDLEELKKTGFASFIIAMIGVIVPLLGGMGCYLVFDNNPGDKMNMIKAAFIGVVLTATSVSITVETLREMGKLKSRVGTAILGAAVIDDILGIIVLTILSALTDPSVRPMFVLARIVAFFVFVAVVGLLMYKAFLKMEQKWHKHRRIAIYAVAFALLMSYVAERFFGIADITGAYFAGIVLCSLADVRDYVASKTNVLGYMLFSPLFFASIGIKTNMEGLTGSMIGFAVISFRDNGWGGFFAQGIGTSMLQVPNIIKNPRIWLAPTLASAVTGPVATCIFGMQMNGAPISSGMGTCGLVGQIGVYTGWLNDIAAGAKTAVTAMDWLGLVLICFVLPAVLSFVFDLIFRKIGWVKDGDMKIDA